MASKAVASKMALGFGMVTIQCAIHPVEETPKDLSFDLASPDGNPTKQMYRDEVTGALMEPSERIRGVRDAEGAFHAIDDVTYDAIQTAGTCGKSMQVLGFMPAEDLPLHRVRRSYFLRPSDPQSARALVLLRDAMVQEGRVGVLKFSLRKGTNYASVVMPVAGSVMLLQVAWAEDCVHESEASESLAGVEATPQELAMAAQLVTAYSVDAGVLESLVDESRVERRKAMAAAVVGDAYEPVKAEEAPATGDLMAALAASLNAAAPADEKPKKSTKPASAVKA